MPYILSNFFSISQNNFHNKLFIIWLFSKVISGITLIQKNIYNKYPKTANVANGYSIFMSIDGIFSLYPNISITSDYYMFNSTILPKDSEEESKNYLDRAWISQFSGEDDENEKRYLIIINRIIFILNEKGNFLLYKDLSSEIKNFNIPSLVAYKFSNNFYYFTIGYASEFTTEYYFYYYKFYLDNNNEGQISLIKEINKNYRIRI